MDAWRGIAKILKYGRNIAPEPQSQHIVNIHMLSPGKKGVLRDMKRMLKDKLYNEL